MLKPKEIVRNEVYSSKERVREKLRETATNETKDSIEEYGGDKLDEGVYYVKEKSVEAADDIAGKIKDKAYEKVRDRIVDERPKEKADYGTKANSGDKTSYTQTDCRGEQSSFVKEKPKVKADTVKTKDHYIGSEYEAKRNASNRMRTKQVRSNNITQKQTAKTARAAAEKAAKTTKRTARTVGKGTVKTAQRASVKTAKTSIKSTRTGIKTAERTAKTAVKTAKTTAKVTQKAAQAAAKAAKLAAQTAVRAAKLAIKAAIAAAKAIAAAVKALIAAIAAGGWVAVVIILIVALVAFILCTCFGVFASNETEDGSKPMTEAILSIDTEFKDEIDTKIAELSVGEYDQVIVQYAGDMDGDSPYVINWNNAIAVYAVTVTMDAEAPTDVVEITHEKIERLREIFYDMNTVSYSTEIQEIETAEDGETASILIITVDVQSMDYLAAAEIYAFTDDQMEALEAMMEPRMLPLYAELTGTDLYGGTTPEELTDIISGLLPGEKGTAIVNAAITRLGDPYSQPKRGSGRYVDCSYLVWWAYQQAGISIPSTSVSQAQWCFENGFAVGESELMPGDLIFWTKTNCHCGRWNEIHHVGIYIGNGRCIEASSGKGRVVVREIWEGSNYNLFMYARPK